MGHNGGEPITRETIFLKLDKGGLGLLDPLKQQLALQVKYAQYIVQPSSKLKWVHLARYWIGFQLAPLHPARKFLRGNNRPKPDTNLFPDYYGDILAFLKKHPITPGGWVTREIYLTLCKDCYQLLTALKYWQKNKGVQTDLMWKGVYKSHARGYHQDAHYKFLHRVHATNTLLYHRLRRKGYQNPFCPSCDQYETHAHAFFECEHAYAVWRVVKPTLAILLSTTKVQLFKLVLNIFQAGVSIGVRNMVTTLLQTILHQIWLNRNFNKFEHRYQPVEVSRALIATNFRSTLSQQFACFKTQNNVPKFRALFCHTPQVCRVDRQGSLHVNLVT